MRSGSRDGISYLGQENWHTLKVFKNSYLNLNFKKSNVAFKYTISALLTNPAKWVIER